MVQLQQQQQIFYLEGIMVITTEIKIIIKTSNKYAIKHSNYFCI